LTRAVSQAWQILLAANDPLHSRLHKLLAGAIKS